MTPVCGFPSAHIVAQCCTCEAALLAKIPRNLAIDFTRITHANSLAFALLYTVSADEGELTECSLCGRRQTQTASIGIPGRRMSSGRQSAIDVRGRVSGNDFANKAGHLPAGA